MLTIRTTTQFKKDVKRAKKQGKNLDILKAVMERIAQRIPLERKYRDHVLVGNYKGRHECHLIPLAVLNDYFPLLQE